MRILYVAHNQADPSKGAANADLSLLAAMSARGHEIEQVWNIGEPRLIRHDNLHLLLEAPRKCKAVVLRQASAKPYDVVFVNQPLGWRAARALRDRKRGPMFVARSHGWEPRVFEEERAFLPPDGRSPLRRCAAELMRPWVHRHNRLLVRWSSGVVVGSVGDRDYLVTDWHLPPDRVLAVAPGVPEMFLARQALPLTMDRCRRLLYVGQFAAVKAPGTVAGVISELLSQHEDMSASWVCASKDHHSVRALLAPEVLGRVTLLDWMARSELIKTYDAHGIFLFPSLFEGFGQTFLEAMARGLIVLATRVGGMADVVEHGRNGFLFDRGSPQEMSHTANAILEGRIMARRVGQAARLTAHEYTWGRAAERLDEFLQSLGVSSTHTGVNRGPMVRTEGARHVS